jgi:actin-related protein 8
LTGGGAQLKGLAVLLQQQLQQHLPPHVAREHVVIIERPKVRGAFSVICRAARGRGQAVLPRVRCEWAQDLHPQYVAWKGGAVLACLPSSRECWISREDWESAGVRMARERLPFEW